jgi:outer membrane receptor protein involved in Fe transport
VIAAGAAVDLGKGFSASLRLRHFGAAPLIEDDSVRSHPTTLVNFGGYYTTGRVRLGVDLLNLFDAKDADISYYYASRLPGEAEGGVDDLHIHPVEPRQVRVKLRYGF